MPRCNVINLMRDFWSQGLSQVTDVLTTVLLVFLHLTLEPDHFRCGFQDMSYQV